MNHPEIESFIEPNLLKDNCAFIAENEPVRHVFTEEELISLKDEFYELAKDKNIRQNSITIFKEVINKGDLNAVIDCLKILTKQPFGEMGLKQLTKDADNTLQNINRGHEERLMTLYAMPYYEEEIIAFYSADGKYVYNRPMTSSEKQRTIFSNIKKLA